MNLNELPTDVLEMISNLSTITLIQWESYDSFYDPYGTDWQFYSKVYKKNKLRETNREFSKIKILTSYIN